MDFFHLILLLVYGLSWLLLLPAFFLFLKRMIKDPISNWQAFLMMTFSLILSQVFFHLARKYPWELFRYTYEEYRGSWAHPDKYIELIEAPILGYEFWGFILLILAPFLFRLIFRKLLDQFVPLSSLALLLPIYILTTVHISPSYEFIKKYKVIDVRDNFQ